MMNLPISWFQNDNPIYKAIISILPYDQNSCDIGEYMAITNILNDSYLYCRGIITDEEPEKNFYDYNFWLDAYSTKEEKYIALSTYILLNYELSVTDNHIIQRFLNYSETQDIISIDHYKKRLAMVMEKMDELPKKSCNFGVDPQFPLVNSFTSKDIYSITNRFNSEQIEELINQYDSYDQKLTLCLKIKKAWNECRKSLKPISFGEYTNVLLNESNPVNSYFFEKLKFELSHKYGNLHPPIPQAYEDLSIDFFFSSHYNGLSLSDYPASLQKQIEDKFSVIEGQEEARSLWYSAYQMLKEYELQIESDYELLVLFKKIDKETKYYRSFMESDSYQIYDSIECMHAICAMYHEKVEPYLRLKNFDKQDNASNEKIMCKWTRQQVMYLAHHSGLVTEGTAVEWGALLSILTGYSQHTLRRDFWKYSTASLLEPNERKAIEAEYQSRIESMKNKSKG